MASNSWCRFGYLGLLAVILLIQSAESGTDEEAADWFVSKGRKLVEEDKHVEAIEEFTKSIKILPGHHEAHLLRGDSYFALGDKQAALADYQVAARTTTDFEDEGDYALDDEVDEAPAAPVRKKKKKKAIGELHEGADSLQIGFGGGAAAEDEEEDYEYEPAPDPDKDANEVQRVANPHPPLWSHYDPFKLDISEKWFRSARDHKHGYEADTAASEVAALKQFYEEMQGDSWIMNAHWHDGDPCKHLWWGVECEAIPGTATPTVVSINVQGNSINGTLSDSLGALVNLKRFNVKGNGLKGKLPDVFGKFAQLEVLKLGENKISVPLGALSGSRSLRVIDLAECFPIGELSELAALTELEELKISGAFDGLRGPIPAALGANAPKLRKLNLAGGQLNGQIPDTLGHLEELSLHKNELEGTIPASILASSTLHKLDLGHNFLWGDMTPAEDPKALAQLRVLNLGQNNLTATPEALDRLFGHASHLQAVELSNNPLEATLPKVVSSKNLHTVRINSARLSGELPEAFGELEHLYELILHDNLLSGSIPASFANSKALVTLRLYNNKLSGELPQQWSTPLLKRLDVHSNELTGALPASIYNQPSLEDLYADHNQLDELPEPTKELAFCGLEGNKVDAPAACFSPSITRAGPRKFRICDTRVEVYVDVLREGYGWTETYGNDWDTAFGECFGGSHEYRHLRSNQKIMELPDLEMIWDKGKYAANMERYRRTSFEGQSLAGFMTHIPRSFILPSQQDEFDQYYATLPKGSWWLLKPRASCCGRGIKLINDTSEIPRGALGVGEGYIVQKFLHNPYLVAPGATKRNDWWHTGNPSSGVVGKAANLGKAGEYIEKGYKFVIRLFVVATSIEPLQMYTYPDGLLFWTRGPHSTSSKDWKDRANFITDYFFTDAQNNLQLTLSELRNLMAQHGVDEQKYWAQIKEVTSRALLPVTHRIAQQESKFISRRGGGFHVWGYDIATDEDLNPMVLEINAHPNTDLEIVKVDREPDRINMIRGDRDLVMGLTEHMTRLIGMFDQSEGKEREQAEAVVQGKIDKLAWHKEGSCTAQSARCLSEADLEDLVHAELEDARSGPMERSFPTCSQKHLRPMLMKQLPRTELLLDYWSSEVGDCHLYNEDGTYKGGRAPFISYRNKKRFSRDEL